MYTAGYTDTLAAWLDEVCKYSCSLYISISLELALKHSCKVQKLICVAQEKRNQNFPMCAVTAVIYHISALVPLSGWRHLTSDTRAMFLAQSGSALLKCISILTGCQPVSLTTRF